MVGNEPHTLTRMVLHDRIQRRVDAGLHLGQALASRQRHGPGLRDPALELRGVAGLDVGMQYSLPFPLVDLHQAGILMKRQIQRLGHHAGGLKGTAKRTAIEHVQPHFTEFFGQAASLGQAPNVQGRI